MHKFSRLAALLIAGAIVSTPALAAGKGEVAKVNGQSIAQNVFDAFMAEQKAQGAPDSPELKAAIKEELIRRELLTQEAKKKGLDKKAEVLGQLELARQAVLVRAVLSEHVRANPVKDEKLKQDYENIKTQAGNTEYKSRHVLVDKEEDAKAIIAKLDKGEKIADLAKQSKDPGSRDNGGDLGWSAPAAYVPPFAEALKTLKKGEYTRQPVKSELGYHVILLEDSRPLSVPPFEEIKPRLLQQAQSQQINKLVDGLRAKAKVD